MCYQAAGALAAYLTETQKTDLSHLGPLTIDEEMSQEYMELDLTARRTLELTETFRGKEKRGSLLWVLDKTRTPMGHRLIRAWLEQPLCSPAAIGRRQEAVAAPSTSRVLSPPGWPTRKLPKSSVPSIRAWGLIQVTANAFAAILGSGMSKSTLRSMDGLSRISPTPIQDTTTPPAASTIVWSQINCFTSAPMPKNRPAAN